MYTHTRLKLGETVCFAQLPLRTRSVRIPVYRGSSAVPGRGEEKMKRSCSLRVGVMHALLPGRTLTAYIKPPGMRNGNHTNWSHAPVLLLKHCTNSVSSWDLQSSASFKSQINCGHTINCAHGLRRGGKSRYGLPAPTEHKHGDNQRIDCH